MRYISILLRLLLLPISLYIMRYILYVTLLFWWIGVFYEYFLLSLCLIAIIPSLIGYYFFRCDIYERHGLRGIKQLNKWTESGVCFWKFYMRFLFLSFS